MSAREPITCHVLNTVTGKPAVSINVTLCLVQPVHGVMTSLPLYQSQTNSDGRVTIWTPLLNPGHYNPVLSQAMKSISEVNPDEVTTWSLKFDVDSYFGGDCFFPEVEVKFKTDTANGMDHWHVPVLLSPYSYTTYRGS